LFTRIIDPAKFGKRRLHKILDVAWVRHIASDREGSNAEMLDSSGGILAALFLAGAKYHVRAHFRQPFGYLAPESNRGPGDDGNASREVKELPRIHVRSEIPPDCGK